jgi:hypothetical protein
MGQKLSLTDVSFTDNSLPILRDDEGLTAGSLAMLDMTHSYVTNIGVPANGDGIYNIATREAAALIGSGSATSLGFSWNNTFTTSEAKFERTTKKALHGVVSRSAQGGHAAYLRLSDVVAEYLRANSGRAYAAFLWGNVTRAALSSSNLFEVGIGNNASFAVNNLVSAAFSNAVGTQRVAVSRPTGWQGAAPAGVSTMAKEAVAFGNIPAYNSANPNEGRSFVLYRFHIIDVLASGKTYDQLNEADAALYAKFFAAGGRYHGDSWALDPADIP